jgi:hypothetical protein
MNSDDNDLITPTEHDQIVTKVWEECQKIYDYDYRANNKLPLFDLPWENCTTCGTRHRCTVSVIDMSAECCECRFKRRLKEEEERLKADKLKRRAEQLKDFAEL